MCGSINTDITMENTVTESKMEALYDSGHEDSSYDDTSESTSGEDTGGCEEPAETPEYMHCPWKKLSYHTSFSSTHSLPPFTPKSDCSPDDILSHLGTYEAASDRSCIFEKSFVQEVLDSSILAPYIPKRSTCSTNTDEPSDSNICTSVEHDWEEEEVFITRELDSLRQEPKYYHVANELLTSERTYVQDLSVIEKKIHSVILLAQRGGRPILPDKLCKQIFLNIRDIYTFNKNLLDELEDRMEMWDPESTGISDILIKRADGFLKYEDAQVIYATALKEHKPFAKLVNVVEHSHFSRQVPLHYFMVTPIQRLPKYILLMKDYYKKLPNHHPDKEPSKEALEQISEVTRLLNDRMVNKEDHDEIMKIQDWFSHETLLEPGRKFYLKGPVYNIVTDTCTRRPASQKKKHRILFLFSDILLVAKVSFNNKLKTVHKIPLVGMKVDTTASTIGFTISCSTESTLNFACRDIEERDKWVKYINILVQEIEKFSNMGTATLEQAVEKRISDIYVPGEERGYRNGEILEIVEKEKMKLGLGGTLSSYAQYYRSGDIPHKRWLVLTYTALIGYQNHKNDIPIWALPLSGCELLPTDKEDEKYTISLSSPVGQHHINFGNEYDFNLWSKKFRELLYFSFSN